MDIQMPVLDGLEATKQLRLKASCKSLPIIALSGDSNDEAKEEAKKSGVDDYLVKPITADALKDILARWL